ncbi:MAG: IclR family transcriptional regulator, partial [Armatimonadota bacterium]
MTRSVRGVGVLDKCLVILEALQAGPMGLSALVRATGLNRATAHRLATALEGHGLVQRDEEGRFALGLRLLALARGVDRAGRMR